MRKLHLILSFALATILPFATAQAAPADLSETGQATCYNTAGTIIACATTGQDGDLKAGVAWPVPRFTPGFGPTVACVTDNLTGLMWVGAPDNTYVTWTAALTSANNLTLCGFSDWRLPNVNELGSLVNLEVAFQSTFLRTQGFLVQNNSFWSSSSFAADATRAWTLSTGDGGFSAAGKALSSFAQVWPVRAGQ